MKWLFALFLSCTLFASPQEELFHIFGINPIDSVRETELLWRQQGKERWDYESRYEYLKPQVWPLFEEMGLVQAIKPSRTHYDGVIIFGALLKTVQKRIQYLCETGVTFDRVILLTGERPLRETEKSQLVGLQTETEMMEWAYRKSDIPKDIPVIVIHVPMKEGIRPNTQDTVEAWAETNPVPGTYLAISNQPYVHYQDAVINRYGPFPVETVGPAIHESASVDLILDTLAREIAIKSLE